MIKTRYLSSSLGGLSGWTESSNSYTLARTSLVAAVSLVTGASSASLIPLNCPSAIYCRPRPMCSDSLRLGRPLCIFVLDVQKNTGRSRDGPAIGEGEKGGEGQSLHESYR